MSGRRMASVVLCGSRCKRRRLSADRCIRRSCGRVAGKPLFDFGERGVSVPDALQPRENGRQFIAAPESKQRRCQHGLHQRVLAILIGRKDRCRPLPRALRLVELIHRAEFVSAHHERRGKLPANQLVAFFALLEAVDPAYDFLRLFQRTSMIAAARGHLSLQQIAATQQKACQRITLASSWIRRSAISVARAICFSAPLSSPAKCSASPNAA